MQIDIKLQLRKQEQPLKAAVKALGLELFAPEAPSVALTAIKIPEDVDGLEVVKTMREVHGVTIAGGQAQAKGKIIRIAHMGHISQWDLLTAFAALEITLAELGYDFERGAGIAALTRELKKK